MHPCTYDAYGMTLVEAAAFGCPSLVNGGGAVGATELLGADGCVQVGPACWIVALGAPQLGSPASSGGSAGCWASLYALERSARVAQIAMGGWGATVDACQRLSFCTLNTQVNLAELDPEQLAQVVLDALGKPSQLEAVAAAARERALGYDEAACGQKLLLALQGTVAV